MGAAVIQTFAVSAEPGRYEDETIEAIGDGLRRGEGALEVHSMSLYQVADYPKD
jgi:hypothetical protein